MSVHSKGDTLLKNVFHDSGLDGVRGNNNNGCGLFMTPVEYSATSTIDLFLATTRTLSLIAAPNRLSPSPTPNALSLAYGPSSFPQAVSLCAGHLVSSSSRIAKPPAEECRDPARAPERQAMSTILALAPRAVSAPVHRRFRAWNADARLSTSRLFLGRPVSSQPPAQIRIGESGAERALNG